MTEHLEETGIKRPSSWSETQDRQLRDLCIVPWNVRDSNNAIVEEIGAGLYSELMRCRLEVADIFTISMKPYYRRLRQAHKHHKPISEFTNANLDLYLKWFLWDQGGIAVSNGNGFVSQSELSEYVLSSHGFVPHERYPFIVARPSAIILPKAGISDEERVIPMDIYELSDGVRPEALPKHCKDLMMLRLHVMQVSELLQTESGAQPKGMVMFISKDKLEDAVVFEVTLGDSERELHEYLEVLSEHYLGEVLDKVSKPYLGAREHGLDIDACDEHQLCNLCSPGCPNATKLRDPYQNISGYGPGVHLVYLKNCEWGKIEHVRYGVGIRKENGKLVVRYPLEDGCKVRDAYDRALDFENLVDPSGQLEPLPDNSTFVDKGGNITHLPSHSYTVKQYAVRWKENGVYKRKNVYYTDAELNNASFQPQYSRAVYPSEVDQEVLTIGFNKDENQNKAGIQNGVWGKVVAVQQKEGKVVKVKVLLENEGRHAHFTEKTLQTGWLKVEKFLVLDEAKYMMQNERIPEQSQDDLYIFDFAHDVPEDQLQKDLATRLAEIKALFEIAECCPLNHRKEHLKRPDQIRVGLAKQFCKEQKDIVASTAGTSLDQFKTELLEKRLHYQTLQKPCMILNLECHRGKQRRVLTTKRISKKVNCSFKVRITYYQRDPGRIYAAKSCGHTNHDPRIFSLGESVPDKLHTALDTLFKERDHSPKQAFMHLSRWGRAHFSLNDEEMSWLTLSACKKARRQFLNSENAALLRNDQESCRKLMDNNADTFLYLEDEPGNWQMAFTTKEQREVLRVCSKMIFIDACHSLNKKGDITLTMMVRDPYGNGFPVAYCVCSGGETAAKWRKFLKAVIEVCDLDPETITFMLDKSTACIAALKSLRYRYVLCIFHVMQAWGRHLRSADSPVREDSRRHAVLKYVRKLSLMTLDQAFDREEASFREFLQRIDSSGKLLAYYNQEWSHIDDTWSRHGRRDLRDMKSDTNNLLERFFRSVKRDYLRGMRAKRRDLLIQTLINKATDYHIEVLKSKLANRDISQRELLQRQYDEAVAYFRTHIRPVVLPETPDSLASTSFGDDRVLRMLCKDGMVHYSCLGDLSCTCDENEDDICMHIQAVMHGDNGECHLNLDHIMAAADIVRRGLQHQNPAPVQKMREDRTSDEPVDVYECWPISFYITGEFPAKDSNKRRLPYFVNTSDNICTCHCYNLLSICPHLIGLGCSSEDDLREIMTQMQGSFSIEKNNEVNEEWITALQAQLELAPHTQNGIALPRRDDASRISQRRHASGLLSDAMKSMKRDFDAMDDHAQMQWLNDFMLPSMNQIKVFKERHAASSNNNSSHVSGSRAFDCRENRFVTQVRFSGQSSSARDSENALFSDGLEYLAQFTGNTEEEESVDIDATPCPPPAPSGQIPPNPGALPRGTHVEATLRSIRENLRDNATRQ